MTTFRAPRLRRIMASFVSAAVLATGAAGALAQTYPTKPVRIIVPFAPGGATDMLARVVAQNLSQSLGQSVLVENRPGAATNIGADAVAKAEPDGHTLLIGTLALVVNPALFPSMPYAWDKDLRPVSMIGFVPNLLVVNPSLPVKSVAELIAYGKANPGKLTFGSAGSGGAVHLSGELFKIMSGVDMVHVPYKGSAPAVTDLIGGNLDLIFDNLPSVVPHVRSGKLRGLAVTSSKPSASAPEFPPVADSGLPGYEMLPWNGIFAPAGTPEPIITRLNAELKKILALPEVKESLTSRGVELVGDSPQEFAAFLKKESERWQDLVRKAGIKP